METTIEYLKNQIIETNANTMVMNTMKENLVSLKQNSGNDSVNGI